MTRKKRGYKRETPQNLVRDYKLFAIACEGSKREPAYFNVFQHISGKIAVDVIEDIVPDAEMQNKYSDKSAPRWVLDRAMKYIEKEGLIDEDDLWFVIDKDRWSDEQLREISDYCDQYPNWHIATSNPCFEVWLYFHKRNNISGESNSCSEFKHEISGFEKGGYHPYKFIPDFENAIINARNADSQPEHFLPGIKQTKVYQLGEALINVIGINDFASFISQRLQKLIRAEVERGNQVKK
jgi:hypothetical protein